MDWFAEHWGFLISMVFFGLVVLRGPLISWYLGIKSINVHVLAKRLAEPSPPLLIDVRTTMEFNSGHIKQALLVPLSELAQRAPALLKQHGQREVAIICRSGNRSTFGAIALKQAGFPNIVNVRGGMSSWQGQGFPVS